MQSDPQNQCSRQYPLFLWTAQALFHLHRGLEIRTLFSKMPFHAILENIETFGRHLRLNIDVPFVHLLCLFSYWL